MSIPSSLKNLHTGGVNRSTRDAMERAHWKNSAYVINPLYTRESVVRTAASPIICHSLLHFLVKVYVCIHNPRLNCHMLIYQNQIFD